MDTPYRRYVKAMNSASKLAQIEFEKLWARLNVDDAIQSRNILLALLPALIDKYAGIASAATAEYYEAARAEVIPESFNAVLAETVPDEQVQASIKFAVRNLFGEVDDGAQS